MNNEQARVYVNEYYEQISLIIFIKDLSSLKIVIWNKLQKFLNQFSLRLLYNHYHYQYWRLSDS